MGWPAIMPLMLHSQTWGVNAQLLLRSASHKKSQHLHNLQGYLCVFNCTYLQVSSFETELR